MSGYLQKPGGGAGVDSINGLTAAVTLSAGSNVTLNESGNDIEITANFTQEGKYMISGGITWSGTGLTYDVSFLEYFFNGNKTANPTQVTLDASDPTDNRFDAIVVDEAGTVTAITGTASANPEVPAIPEDQLQVTIILVAAGSTTPTIASEEIYMDDPTTNWTFSTYQTATPTGSIDFAGTSSPKQGTECIEASTDARLGARFVRATSFDAYQYTMLQVWVRFTGTAVATNKSLNVRFENSAGTLVGSTVNLFSYGLQRGVLNTWQLVVVPITAFGALPATVKGLKVIMAGGTVGVVRQWDLDYMILTNGSVPFANVPTIAFSKNGTGIASQSGLNLIEGTGVTITGVNNPLYNRVDYTINASGGGGTPAGSDTQIQYNNAGAFGASSDFTFDNSNKLFKVKDTTNVYDLISIGSPTTTNVASFGWRGNHDAGSFLMFGGSTPNEFKLYTDGEQRIYTNSNEFTLGLNHTTQSAVSFTGSGLDDLTLSGTFSGTYPTTYTVTVSSTGTPDTFDWNDGTNSGTGVSMSTSPTLLSNGISITFGADTGHTLSDSWTWTYSYVNQNVLDFSNNDYKFQSTFGTDTFGYQISDNLLGAGISGSVNTWTTTGGDFGISGFGDLDEGFGINSFIQWASGSVSKLFLTEDNGTYEINYLGSKSRLNLLPNEFDLTGILSGFENGVSLRSGIVSLGNLGGGNNTKITIDDVNEHITIGNIKAFDDDAAAGTAGLTAGMVYMTTGSGSAPLNAAGILMIKQ